MSKKKIGALLICATLAVGVVGGTFAWFTSSDSVTNKFSTGSVTDPEGNGPDAGIDVEEEFIGPDGTPITPGEDGKEAEYDKPVLPGDEFVKKVWIDSTADYDQFVRARIVKVWKMEDNEVSKYKEFTIDGKKSIVYYGDNYSVEKDKDGNIVKTDGVTVPTDALPLDYSKIELGFTATNFGDVKESDTWYAPTGFNDAWNTPTTAVGEWYYYNDVLLGKQNPVDKTVNILESVTFKTDANDNYYKNLKFDVKIEGQGIQKSGGAAEDTNWDLNAPAAGITGYKK